MSQAPLFSLVMPCYNHEKYVAQALRSVAAQDYPNIEIIVIDDGSRDKTPEVIEQVCAEIGQSRKITFVRQRNSGVSATLNKGVALAKGKYVGFLASDDYYLPGKVSGDVRALEEGAGSVGLLHTNVEFVDELGRRTNSIGSFMPARDECFLDLLTRRAGAWAPTVVARRELIINVGMHDDSLAAEDYDLWVRLAAAGCRFVFREDITVCKRVLSGSHGHNLRACYEVPFLILDKHRLRLRKDQYREARELLVRWTIRNACSQNDQELASYAARRFETEERNIGGHITLELWTLRTLLGRLLPNHVRSYFRRRKFVH